MPIIPTIELIPYALSSQAEVERIYSVSAVALRTDDIEDADEAAGMINELINFVTGTVFSYTLSHYNSADLVAIPWVRQLATYLTCFYLSRRRGDAAQYVDEAKRAIESLELVRDGEIMIPDQNGFPVPQNAATIPAISSQKVDDRYVHNKLKVVREQSTQPYAGQKFYDVPGLSGDSI